MPSAMDVAFLMMAGAMAGTTVGAPISPVDSRARGFVSVRPLVRSSFTPLARPSFPHGAMSPPQLSTKPSARTPQPKWLAPPRPAAIISSAPVSPVNGRNMLPFTTPTPLSHAAPTPSAPAHTGNLPVDTSPSRITSVAHHPCSARNARLAAPRPALSIIITPA